MWFWNGLSGLFARLRDTAARGWILFQGNPLPAIGIAVVIVIAAVFGSRHSSDFSNWYLRAEPGQIIVNSPTVYTRQRLVNDRLDQTRWLQDQLKLADARSASTPANMPEFRMIDHIQTRQSTVATKVGGGTSAPAPGASSPAPQGGTGSNDPLGAAKDLYTIEPTTAAMFRAKNSYREEVRGEMTQTQLDDRHDIRGNTIYRLSFDATVIAGSRLDAIAGIKVTLGHYPYADGPAPKKNPVELAASPETEKAREARRKATLTYLYEEDYKELYADWMRSTRNTVIESLDALTATLMNREPDPSTRTLIVRFLLGRICELISGPLTNEERLNSSCDPQTDAKEFQKERRAASELFRLYALDRSRSLESVSQARIENDISTMILEGRLRPSHPQTSEKSEQAVGLPAQASPPSSSLPSGQPQQPPAQPMQPAGQPAQGSPAPQAWRPPSDPKRIAEQAAQIYKQVKAFCEKTKEDSVVMSALGLPTDGSNPVVGCPYLDSPTERLVGGIILYELLIDSARNSAAGFDASNVPAILKALEMQRAARCAAQDVLSCGSPKKDVSVRCFAADFLRAKLDAFDRSQVESWERLSKFFDIRGVGREAGDCQVLITSKQQDSGGNLIQELKNALNRNTETFSYSVTPKNLSENVSTAAQTRDSLEILANIGLKAGDKDIMTFANRLAERSERTQGILQHPIVVGFGTGRHPPETPRNLDGTIQDTGATRKTTFGWLIAPRSRGEGELKQIDGQYPLTAVISVPSWWRLVEAHVETCWFLREELHELRWPEDEGVEICNGRQSKYDSSIIRLPGVISELSRKLGLEPLQQPYLSNYQQRHKLQIGKAGSILLTGGRLWRSTEVTLGSQTASKITVLPNMEGIIAEFRCVGPQYGHTVRPNLDGPRVTPVEVRVWTSEGVTHPAQVAELMWPEREGAAAAVNEDFCPANQQPR